MGSPTPQMSSRPIAFAHGGLHLVAPERPERLPVLGNVSEREAGPLQEAVPDMDVVGIPAHRQGIEAASARVAVEQGGRVEGVGIEQAQYRAESALEVDQPVLVSPLSDP